MPTITIHVARISIEACHLDNAPNASVRENEGWTRITAVDAHGVGVDSLGSVNIERSAPNAREEIAKYVKKAEPGIPDTDLQRLTDLVLRGPAISGRVTPP